MNWSLKFNLECKLHKLSLYFYGEPFASKSEHLAKFWRKIKHLDVLPKPTILFSFKTIKPQHSQQKTKRKIMKMKMNPKCLHNETKKHEYYFKKVILFECLLAIWFCLKVIAKVITFKLTLLFSHKYIDKCTQNHFPLSFQFTNNLQNETESLFLKKLMQ